MTKGEERDLWPLWKSRYLDFLHIIKKLCKKYVTSLLGLMHFTSYKKIITCHLHDWNASWMCWVFYDKRLFLKSGSAVPFFHALQHDRQSTRSALLVVCLMRGCCILLLRLSQLLLDHMSSGTVDNVAYETTKLLHFPGRYIIFTQGMCSRFCFGSAN